MHKQKIHFIGIGGIGISGLARLYVHEGWEVSGTNDNPSPQTLDALREQGVEISLDQTELPEADKYVYSDAWLTMNPELLEQARATERPVQNYFEALGEIANQYSLIAVAGSHGKTTTTAMLIDVLEEAGLDPTAIVGSLRSKTGSNFRAGKSQFFIAEACEWKKHFLHLQPDILVITNIEHEHADYFKDLAAVQEAFIELVQPMSPDSVLVCDVQDPALGPVLQAFRGSLIDYTSFLKTGALKWQLQQPGIHNMKNAAAAAAAAQSIGVGLWRQTIRPETITKALENFAGTWRRFQYKGDVNNAPVYDDYAHHPTEIAVTINGTREKYPDKKVIVVFQPHTFSRTKELQADFEAVLQKADEVLLVPIYAARETDDGSISSAMMAENIDAQHFHTLEAAAAAVREIATKDHVVLVMGAGDVTKIASDLT